MDFFEVREVAVGWIFSLAIGMLGLSSAVAGTWVELVGPRVSMAVAGSMLTLLGVIIAIMTLGKATQAQTMQSLEQFGANDITLQVQAREQVGGGGDHLYAAGPVDAAAKITPEMVDELATHFRRRVSGVGIEAGSQYGTVTRGLSTGQSRISFVHADFVSMQSHTLTAGRMLSADDIAGDRSVVVISPEIVETFFNGSPESAIRQDNDLEGDGQYSS